MKMYLIKTLLLTVYFACAASSAFADCPRIKMSKLQAMTDIELTRLLNKYQREMARILRSLQGSENPNMDPHYACMDESYRVLEVLSKRK